MQKFTLLVAALLVTAVAGCASDPYGYGQAANNPTIRTLGGAAAGAVIADATGGSKTTGALIGAVGGALSCGVPGLPACN